MDPRNRLIRELVPVLKPELKRAKEYIMVAGMDPERFMKQARMAVVNYFNDRKDKTEKYELGIGGTYIVWFCKILENWKALVSTVVPDGRYYEVTYNGRGKTTYLDVYQRMDNFATPDKDEVI